jgi:putative hydrolase of the HAD superfamily
MPDPLRRGLTLFIDADDTLWENNVYFERVIDAFCDLVAGCGHPHEHVRETLYAVERLRTRINGYGVNNFHGSLREVSDRLLGADDAERARAALSVWCAELTRESVTPLPGVRSTLRDLCGRHRLILFTKGDPDDQWQKVRRSGLRPYLHEVDVVREKDVDAYRDAIVRHGVRPARTWMVGNSPRSDIAPALEAGLGAVFIPHAATWELEKAVVPGAGTDRFLVLERFSDLVEHF